MGREKRAGMDHRSPVNVVDVDHVEAAGDKQSSRRVTSSIFRALRIIILRSTRR